MRILYIGALAYGGTSRQRFEALRSLGHEVFGIETVVAPELRHRISPSRLLSRLGFAADSAGVNGEALKRAAADRFDILWVDKGLMLRPSTLKAIRRLQPNCRIISYSPDDVLNPGNSSWQYRHCLAHYDLHVTTKSYNAHELLAAGARHTLFVGNAYDPSIHRPIELSPAEQDVWSADVSFVGSFEIDRCRMLRALAISGVQVVVRCSGWNALVGVDPNLRIFPWFLAGDDYARAICGTKVNLCFLRKANRDQQTTRSIEIPACGGFMLAERTAEHLRLFEEGREAAYFSTVEELIEKTKYYLAHDRERVQIAANGRKRCLRSGYSNAERLKTVISQLASLHD